MSYARYSALGGSGGGSGGVPTYANFAALPATAADGSLAVTLDTDTLYVFNAGSMTWIPVGGSGVPLGIGAIDSQTPSPDGLTLATNKIYAQSASATDPGMVNNVAQVFTGEKTFNDDIVIPNSVAHSFAGFDGVNKLETIPGWTFDDIGQTAVNIIAPQPSTSVNQISLDAGISSPLSGGYEGIIVGPNLDAAMNFTSTFNSEATYNTNYNNPGGTTAFQDQGQIVLGSIVGNYSSFASFTGINSNGVQNFRNYSAAMSVNTGLSVNGVVAYQDSNVINPTASVNSYQGFNSNVAVDGGITFFTGVQVGPHGAGAIDNFTGVNIGPNLSTAVTNTATGLSINMGGITDGNPQGVVAINTNGRISVNGTTDLLANQGFQIGSRVEHQFTIQPGSPVTNTDALIVNIAGDYNAQDDVAATGFGLGINSVGFIASLAVAATKTTDTFNVFLPASALPDPGYTTGGTITNMSMIRTFAPLSQGGTLNIHNFYGLKIDNFAGALSSAGANSWGIYVEDPLLHNHFEGLVDMGFLQLNGSTSGVLSHKASAVTTNHTLTWPAAQGAASTVLTNNGSGVLSWAATSAGSTTLTGDVTGTGTGTIPTTLVATSNSTLTTLSALSLPGAQVTGNIAGNAANITATSNSTLTTLSALSLPGSQVTGNIAGNAANITASSNSTLTTLSALSLPGSQVTGNISGNATNITASSNSTLTTLSALSLPLSQTTGILPVTQGGTGLGTLTSGAVVIGAGTSNPTFVSPGTNGDVLTVSGGAWVSAPAGSGTFPGTNWNNSLTFTTNNFGSANENFWSRRVGDSLEIRGTFTALTPNSAVGLINMPAGLTIDSSKFSLGTNIQVVGFGNVLPATTAALFASGGTGISIVYDGLTTSSVYLSFQASSNTYNQDNTNNYIGAGFVVTFLFTVPITQYAF